MIRSSRAAVAGGQVEAGGNGGTASVLSQSMNPELIEPQQLKACLFLISSTSGTNCGGEKKRLIRDAYSSPSVLE